jgi:uncharacterized protein (TIGR03435 family)
MTGLAGVYDFSFGLTPEEMQVLGIRAAVYAGVTLPPQVLSLLDTGGNPLIVAVEKLGLKLDARKAPVDVLVVDNVRRTPLENQSSTSRHLIGRHFGVYGESTTP